MDENTILTTIGKLYLEISRLQQVAEMQQRRILELETEVSVLSQSNTSKKKE